jgi:membrane protease YdiL (CAAX protease family)
MAIGSKSRAVNLPTAFTVWAAIVMITGFAGVWMGYSGKRFAVALGVAAALFAFELFMAVPEAFSQIQNALGDGAPVAVLLPLAAVLVYCLVVSGDWKTTLAAVSYVVVPVLLLATASRSSPGAWQDYAAAICIWLPVWAQWMYLVFPYPSQLTHVLSILLALATGVAGFILVRRLENVGYSLEWRRGFAWNFLFHFLVFAAIAIPLGLKLHFLVFEPSIRRLQPLVIVGILFFTAWPEELLFRGILQNLLSRTFSSEWAGLIVASIVFGFSHIQHAPFPNWKYVLLASIAGFFYGRAWMKTKSIVPGVLMHALVDISWHVLFR